jgi:hypothetical protein
MSASLRMRLLALSAIALLAVITGCGGDGDASPAGSENGVSTTTAPPGKKIAMEVSFDPSTPLAPVCGPSGACVLPLSRTTPTRITGSFTGGAVSSGAGAPTASGGYTAVAFQLFTGSVEGCGTGTLGWTEVLSSDNVTDVSGTWTIAEGTGTDDLATVSGGGTFEGKVNPDLSGTATVSGRIEC